MFLCLILEYVILVFLSFTLPTFTMTSRQNTGGQWSTGNVAGCAHPSYTPPFSTHTREATMYTQKDKAEVQQEWTMKTDLF